MRERRRATAAPRGGGGRRRRRRRFGGGGGGAAASLLLSALLLLSPCRSCESLRGGRRGGSPSRERATAGGGTDEDAEAEAAADGGGGEAEPEPDGGEGGEEEDPVMAEVEGRVANLTERGLIAAISHVDLRDLTLPENVGLDLGGGDPWSASRQVVERITSNLEKRIAQVFEKAKTEECRVLVAEHFSYFVNAIGTETALPFVNKKFNNSCYFDEPVLPDPMPENKTKEDFELEQEEKSWQYKPPRNEAEYIDDPSNLNILYGILTHSDPDAVMRLVDTLYEDGHSFVVHVDGKESAEKTQRRLVEFAASRDHVHILPDQHRVRVNWGGFTMVNATLQVLRYAFALDRPDAAPLDFHKFVHLAESTFPIRSNAQIRRQLAEYPIDANFMHVITKPTNPHEDSWHYFVECDDAVHRIYRLPPKRWSSGGIDMMTSSQWFIISREFAKYLAEALPGTLVRDFLEYAKHMVVADEQFFGTVLRHTKFCHKHQNSNFLFLEFGKWEDRLHDKEARDQRKCVMPDPNHCGRSPTTITVDKIPALALSEKKPLFARKFQDEADPRVKGAIETILRNESNTLDVSFEGLGVLIVAKDTVQDEKPLCLGVDRNTSQVHLLPCFHRGVPETLAPDWEYSGVIINESPAGNRWQLGPCTFDGYLERTESGEMEMTPGIYSPVGPVCRMKSLLKQNGNCLDMADDNVHIDDCDTEWTQLFSFGNGAMAPQGSVHTTVPNHPSHVCLGLLDRDQEGWEIADDHEGMADHHEDNGEESPEGSNGDKTKDEPDTVGSKTRRALASESHSSSSEDLHDDEFLETDEDADGTSFPPLRHFGQKTLTLTDCANVGAVIEWLFIPFIELKDDEEGGKSGTSSHVGGDEVVEEL